MEVGIPKKVEKHRDTSHISVGKRTGAAGTSTREASHSRCNDDSVVHRKVAAQKRNEAAAAAKTDQK